MAASEELNNSELGNYTLYPPKERYFDREISWLRFNMRVLEEAENHNHPLLERLRFLSISATNLDEFFSVRVAGLIALAQDDVQKPSLLGETPHAQLEAINDFTQALMARQQQDAALLLKALSTEAHINLLKREEINNTQKTYLERLFEDKFFPILTPIVIDPIHPFPFIPHQGLSLIVALTDIDHKELHIIMPLPKTLQRFYRLPQDICGDQIAFITVEDIILLNLHILFPNYQENGHGVFSILRDTDLEIEEEAEDLVREFETALQRRKRGKIIRMKMTQDTPQKLVDLVETKLDIACSHITFVDCLIGLSFLSQMIISSRPDLLFERFIPQIPPQIVAKDASIFQLISQKDLMVHHPYQSFDSVVNFLRQSANDPDVVLIKSTLYRTSENSPIIEALIEAAQNGKYVTVIVELKARFDEAANLRQAKALEQAGVHVVYGLAGCKVHAKILLVVRREHQKFKNYVHFGTGNYHPLTAKIYTDISLFTANPQLGEDACRLFNYITGYIEPRSMSQLCVAPITLKETLIAHIKTEIINAQNGKNAAIYAKMNALVDKDMIEILYRASNAGVKIMLNIRGICCLRPHIKGLSENITVISVIGRFLEHSRIICFANGATFGNLKNKVFMSSADWMPRNLERRVELLVPILETDIKARFLEEIIPAFFKDNQQSWQLMPDGSYERIALKDDTEKSEIFCAHDYFIRRALDAS